VAAPKLPSPAVAKSTQSCDDFLNVLRAIHVGYENSIPSGDGDNILETQTNDEDVAIVRSQQGIMAVDSERIRPSYDSVAVSIAFSPNGAPGADALVPPGHTIQKPEENSL
jgi:hypothetical protein